MRVSVSLNHHFCRTADGAVWTKTMFGHSFWRRYLDVFDAVRVIARVRPLPQSAADDWIRADGPQVSFAELPDFVGPSQYLRRRGRVRRAFAAAFSAADAHILRIPSVVSTLTWKTLRRRQLPYGVEVVGDPWDGLSPGSFHHPLLPAFRWMYTTNQRRQCAGAAAASYVTRTALQQRYPCGGTQNGTAEPYLTHYSSVELRPEDLVAAPRQLKTANTTTDLIFVGSIGHLKKAPDVLIRAVAQAVRLGDDLRLTIVGGGSCQPELEQLAANVGIRQRVRFTGSLLAGKPVRDELDDADVFVLPSRHEGLPRAMIEAMGRALPCIGSTVGGFAELVPADDLVPPNDCTALTRKLREVVADPERQTRMSARNLKTAREYGDTVLQRRRVDYFRFLRERTQNAHTADRTNQVCLIST